MSDLHGVAWDFVDGGGRPLKSQIVRSCSRTYSRSGPTFARSVTFCGKLASHRDDHGCPHALARYDLRKLRRRSQKDDPARSGRAAVRWHGRFALEATGCHAFEEPDEPPGPTTHDRRSRSALARFGGFPPGTSRLRPSRASALRDNVRCSSTAPRERTQQ